MKARWPSPFGMLLGIEAQEGLDGVTLGPNRAHNRRFDGVKLTGRKGFSEFDGAFVDFI
jgi:hypothetical protein